MLREALLSCSIQSHEVPEDFELRVEADVGILPAFRRHFLASAADDGGEVIHGAVVELRDHEGDIFVVDAFGDVPVKRSDGTYEIVCGKDDRAEAERELAENARKVLGAALDMCLKVYIKCWPQIADDDRVTLTELRDLRARLDVEAKAFQRSET